MKDEHRKTICDSDIYHLSVSYDEGIVLLFTPDMGNTAKHFHIELEAKEVVDLYLFLSKYIMELMRQVPEEDQSDEQRVRNGLDMG